jgi:hypothetical protein
MKIQGNMTPPKVNNCTIMNSSGREMDGISDKEFKKMTENDQQN